MDFVAINNKNMFEKTNLPVSPASREGNENEIKEKMFKREDLPDGIETKLEIFREDKGAGEENIILEISKKLQDAILVFLCKFEMVKGLEEGEKLSLYFEKGDLMLNSLDESGEVICSWLIYMNQDVTEDKSIEETGNVYEKIKKRIAILTKKKIEELIATENQEDNLDLSEKFLTLSLSEFNKFVEEKKRKAGEDKSNLSLTIYWEKEFEGRGIPWKLKAIYENLGPKFNKSFTIIGTEEDKENIVRTPNGANALNSGIKFIQI